MDDRLLQKLNDYHPPRETIALLNSTRIMFLVGPSGAGKDALKQRLLATGRYHHIVSHTTRAPRINHGVLEQDGKNYHFINLEQAETMLDKHEFIEAKVYSGNVYGTSVAEIQKAHDENLIAITDIEVQGVAEYKVVAPNVMALFTIPPDFDTWQGRLQRRYGEIVDATDYRRRLRTALAELEELFSVDYYMCIINDNLDEVFEEAEKIAETGKHDEAQEAKARQVAHKLYEDIQHYLEEQY
jgi:guanylate kinase